MHVLGFRLTLRIVPRCECERGRVCATSLGCYLCHHLKGLSKASSKITDGFASFCGRRKQTAFQPQLCNCPGTTSGMLQFVFVGGCCRVWHLIISLGHTIVLPWRWPVGQHTWFNIQLRMHVAAPAGCTHLGREMLWQIRERQREREGDNLTEGQYKVRLWLNWPVFDHSHCSHVDVTCSLLVSWIHLHRVCTPRHTNLQKQKWLPLICAPQPPQEVWLTAAISGWSRHLVVIKMLARSWHLLHFPFMWMRNIDSNELTHSPQREKSKYRDHITFPVPIVRSHSTAHLAMSLKFAPPSLKNLTLIYWFIFIICIVCWNCGRIDKRGGEDKSRAFNKARSLVLVSNTNRFARLRLQCIIWRRESEGWLQMASSALLSQAVQRSTRESDWHKERERERTRTQKFAHAHHCRLGPSWN